MIFIFLPAYNEEIALKRLLPKIHSVMTEKGMKYHVVILNDGSEDRTSETAKDLSQTYPLTLLTHTQNQGLGMTMVDGLKHIASISAPTDYIITLDCDDTHEPRYIPPALQKLKEGFDIAILSRFEEGGKEEGLSWIRKFLSRGAALFLKTFFPIQNVQDYSCSFRAFRASIIQKAFKTFDKNFIRLPQWGFVVASEILIKLRMLNAKMIEVPFTLKYDQKPGKSKNNTLRTIMGYFALVALYWRRENANIS